MFKDKSLRFRIYSLIAPLLFAIAWLSWQSITRSRTATLDAKKFIVNIISFELASESIHEIQKERGMSGLFSKQQVSKDELNKHHQVVDRTLTQWIQGEGFKSNPSIVALRNWIDDLKSIRTLVEKGATESELVPKYNAFIGDLITAESILATASSFQGFEAKLNSLIILEGAKENFGRMRARGSGIIADDRPISEDDVNRLTSYRTAALTNFESPALLMSEKGKANYKTLLQSEELKATDHSITQIVNNYKTGKYGLNTDEYFKKISHLINQSKALLTDELKQLEEISFSLAKAAELDFYITLSSLILLFVLFIVFITKLLNSVTTRLEQIASGLSSVSRGVFQNSNEMNEASTSISSGSTEQGAALEETSAALDEIRSIAAKNADAAAQAQEASQVCSDNVTQGLEVMKELTSAMTRISENTHSIDSQVKNSNEQLSEIVKVIAEIENKTRVINDIVFQTKLLSFNASVEAARAGEHGKGFSVVAEEVGNLARMSGTASHDISELLNQSVDKVKSIIETNQQNIEKLMLHAREQIVEGTNTVQKGNDVFSVIFNDVQSIKDRARDVAVGSSEQSTGVDEISKALHQLSQVNQQATATSQDAQRVSDDLRDKASELQTEVRSLLVCINGEGDNSDPFNRDAIAS